MSRNKRSRSTYGNKAYTDCSSERAEYLIWLNGCFVFNGSFGKYLSLRDPSPREREKEEKTYRLEKNIHITPPAPTKSIAGPHPAII